MTNLVNEPIFFGATISTTSPESSKDMKLFVIYDDYGHDGCSEPIAVFSSWAKANEFCERENRYDIRYIELKLDEEPSK